MLKIVAVLAMFVVILQACANQTIKEPQEGYKNEIIAENLNIPWEIAFLPDGDILVTERPGILLRIGGDKKAIVVSGVHHLGEGGLLGLALHPQFEHNQFIYLYFTSNIDGNIENRVERYRLNLDKNVLEDKKIIISGIPGAIFHDGGRIAFGPDNYLYITTGDARNPQNSQNKDSLAGKILRVDDEGNVPGDNPFGNAVYSWGHRNPQGIAWDNQGALWSTEHGRSGILSGLDELNLIKEGKNYGWDIIQGSEQQATMVSPIIHSGPDITWAPGDVAFLNGKIFFTGLKGEALYEYEIETGTLDEHFATKFGRLRAVVVHNSSLYISTSNRDGRGNPREGDDKIIRIYVE